MSQQEAILGCCFSVGVISYRVEVIKYLLVTARPILQPRVQNTEPERAGTWCWVSHTPSEWLGYLLVYCGNKKKTNPLWILCLSSGMEKTWNLTTSCATGEPFPTRCYRGVDLQRLSPLVTKVRIWPAAFLPNSECTFISSINTKKYQKPCWQYCSHFLL